MNQNPIPTSAYWLVALFFIVTIIGVLNLFSGHYYELVKWIIGEETSLIIISFGLLTIIFSGMLFFRHIFPSERKWNGTALLFGFVGLGFIIWHTWMGFSAGDIGRAYLFMLATPLIPPALSAYVTGYYIQEIIRSKMTRTAPPQHHTRR